MKVEPFANLLSALQALDEADTEAAVQAVRKRFYSNRGIWSPRATQIFSLACLDRLHTLAG